MDSWYDSAVRSRRDIEVTVFMVYYRNADSWNSFNQLPIAVFLDKDAAAEYASKQPGYGLNVDWFVKEVPLNPEVVK